MAQIKVIYVNSDGRYQEHSESADTVQFSSFQTANFELTDAKLGRLVDGADSANEHIHDTRYFREDEHIDSSAGVADAGKPIVIAADGFLDESLIDSATLAPTLDHGLLGGLLDDDHTQYILVDGTRAFSGDISIGGNKITNLADPTTGTDAVNLQTLQAYQEGLKPKEAVRVATVSNLTLSGPGSNIDGITLNSGDRVLVKDQTLPEENGIYVFNGAGSAMTRAEDFDSLTPIDEINGAYTAVQEGTTHAGKKYVQFGTVATLGTDPINFTFFNGADDLTASTGLVRVGDDFRIDASAAGAGLGFSAGVLSANVDDATIEIDTDTLRVKADGINDTHIDFGLSANQVNAEDIPIIDAGALTSQTTVEGSLQELYGLISASGVEYTVGTGGVSAGDLVYVSANDTVQTYDDLSNGFFGIGLALTTETASSTVKVLSNDTVVSGVLTGATAGTEYFWDGTSLTTTIPSGSGAYVWRAGVAKNATDLQVEVEFVRRNSIA